jgi:hypothetical protein
VFDLDKTLDEATRIDSKRHSFFDMVVLARKFIYNVIKNTFAFNLSMWHF